MSLHEVLCTLAKWHKGEHSDVGIRGRKSCGFVMGHVEIEDEDPAGSPEEHRQREEDEIQEGAERSAPYQPFAEEAVPAVEPVALSPEERREVDACNREAEAAMDAAVPDSGPYFADSPSGADVPGDESPGPVSPEPVASAVAGEPEPTASPEALTAAVVAAYADFDLCTVNVRQAEREADEAREVLVRAIDAKARSLAPGAICVINGVHHSAKRPPKPRGKPVDAGALWTLKRVEVAK